MKYDVTINGSRRGVAFDAPTDESSHVVLDVDGRRIEADLARISPTTYSILLSGRSLEVTVEESPRDLLVRLNGREYHVGIHDSRSWRRGRGAGVELEGRQQLIAPMPGKIVRVLVAAGESVESGQGLLVIEAMKMQNEIRAPKSGTVERVVSEGQTVNAGEILAVVA